MALTHTHNNSDVVVDARKGLVFDGGGLQMYPHSWMVYDRNSHPNG